MKTIKATYDGSQFQPDEPVNIPINSRAIIVVMDQEEEEWYTLATSNLNRAYENDGEPDYSLSQLKEPNSSYEGR